jgi:hypothetical protein
VLFAARPAPRFLTAAAGSNHDVGRRSQLESVGLQDRGQGLPDARLIIDKKDPPAGPPCYWLTGILMIFF